MLAALTVPAFAADITISKDEPAAGPDGAQTATVDVVTKTTNTEGADAYTYSVTFPLRLNLPGVTPMRKAPPTP